MARDQLDWLWRELDRVDQAIQAQEHELLMATTRQDHADIKDEYARLLDEEMELLSKLPALQAGPAGDIFAAATS